VRRRSFTARASLVLVDDVPLDLKFRNAARQHLGDGVQGLTLNEQLFAESHVGLDDGIVLEGLDHLIEGRSVPFLLFQHSRRLGRSGDLLGAARILPLSKDDLRRVRRSRLDSQVFGHVRNLPTLVRSMGISVLIPHDHSIAGVAETVKGFGVTFL
jgi:hypothetical protein